jgi:hypothetical protein
MFRHQLSQSCAIAAMTIAAIASPSQASPPIVRPSGQPQRPSCFIEMPNQAMQNLDGLCVMGKPKPKASIDMVTDQDKDGIPDELAVAFRKLDAIFEQTPPQGQEAAAMRQMAQVLRELNERLPYAETTKAAMREMTQMMERGTLGGPNPADSQRFTALDRQMRQDPVFNQIQELNSRYQQLKYERNMPR